MTPSNQKEIAPDCSDHDHETEKPGCSCGGICGRRELLEKLNDNLEGESNIPLPQENTVEQGSAP